MPDPRWDDDALRTLRRLRGRDFEAMDASSLRVSAHRGQTRAR